MMIRFRFAPGERVAGVNDPLWRYLLVLTAWWREIAVGAALFTILVSAAALAGRLLLPTYETSADVTMVATAANRSIDDAQSGGLNPSARIGIRRAALVGLAHNTSVARKVIERLRGQLDEEEAREAVLLEKITAEIVMTRNGNRLEGSDLIRITASADSPEKTAAIANAWAEEYVIHVNRLYEPARESLMASIAEELKRAREDYHAAQSDLEAFMAGNNLDRLNRLIEAKKGIVAQLTDLWRVGIDSQLSKLEIEQRAGATAINERTESRTAALLDEYEKQREVKRLLADARSLRTQVETGGEASVASNGLALILLKAGAYASSAAPARSLNVTVDGAAPHADAAGQLADVNALIVALEARNETLESSIERLSRDLPEYFRQPAAAAEHADGARDSTLWNPAHVRELNERINGTDDSEISRLVAEVEDEAHALIMEREARMATHHALVEDRNIKRSALTTLQNQSVELRVGISSAETPEVRLASPAATPAAPSGTPLSLIAILAGVAGIAAAVFLAFLAAALNVRPLFEKPEAEQRAGAAG